MGRPKGSKNRKKKKLGEFTLPQGTISKYRMHPFLGQPQEIRIEMLAKALINNRGFFSAAARELNCDITTVSKIVKESDYLAYVVAEIDHHKWDKVETLVWDKALEGDENNLKRICTHKEWKNRGYEHKPEVQINQNTFKQVVINVPGEESRTLLEEFESKNLLEIENNESI